MRQKFYSSNTTFSGQIYKTAAKKLVNLEPDARQSGEVIFHSFITLETIILSATALEAGINEVISWYGTDFGGNVKLPDYFLEKEVRAKWHELPTMLNKKTFDKGSSIWQNFENLINLRNIFVHYKFLSPPKKFLQFFESKKLITLDGLGDAPSWTEALLTNKVAEWAVGTVPLMFDELTTLLEQEHKVPWPWSSKYFFKR